MLALLIRHEKKVTAKSVNPYLYRPRCLHEHRVMFSCMFDLHPFLPSISVSLSHHLSFFLLRPRAHRVWWSVERVYAGCVIQLLVPVGQRFLFSAFANGPNVRHHFQVSLSIPQPPAARIQQRRSRKTSRITTPPLSVGPRFWLPTVRPRSDISPLNNTHMHMHTHT